MALRVNMIEEHFCYDCIINTLLIIFNNLL